jgi:TatD DNase family protein
MLESDAPVLGPDPGNRNAPANITLVVEKIAELKGCSVQEVRRVTTENAWRFFRLDRFGQCLV